MTPQNLYFQNENQWQAKPPSPFVQHQNTLNNSIVTQVQPISTLSSFQKSVSNLPPGLEKLATVDQFTVQKSLESFEQMVGFETQNQFIIKSGSGENLFLAAMTNTECFVRKCFGSSCPFDIIVCDFLHNEVIHLKKSFTCFPLGLHSMNVESPPGNFIGSIEQTRSISYPNFWIKNANQEVVFRIVGPYQTFSVYGDVEFKIVSKCSEEIGKISKQYAGSDLCVDADIFGIGFKTELDDRMKAVMLGACFFIDDIFYKL